MWHSPAPAPAGGWQEQSGGSAVRAARGRPGSLLVLIDVAGREGGDGGGHRGVHAHDALLQLLRAQRLRLAGWSGWGWTAWRAASGVARAWRRAAALWWHELAADPPTHLHRVPQLQRALGGARKERGVAAPGGDVLTNVALHVHSGCLGGAAFLHLGLGQVGGGQRARRKAAAGGWVGGCTAAAAGSVRRAQEPRSLLVQINMHQGRCSTQLTARRAAPRARPQQPRWSGRCAWKCQRRAYE